MATAVVREYPVSRPWIGRFGSVTWPWSYVTESGRDLRLDLLRGFAVFAMVVDHVAGASWARLISGGGEFFVSAAEAFVFISGFVMGMVYRSHIAKHGMGSGVEKALRRSFTLYKLTVVLSLIFAAELTLYHIDFGPVGSLGQFVTDVVFLRQTLYLADIPLIYTLLLTAGAAALVLMTRKKTPWLLAASFGLWLAHQINPTWFDSLPWPIENNPMFHFAAWQLYFIFGLAMGYHRRTLTERLRRLPVLPLFFGSASLFALSLYLHLTSGRYLPGGFWPSQVADSMDGLFSKSEAGPLRVAATVIVFTFVYLLVTHFWKPIQQSLGWLLLPLGQNALYAYTVHVLLIGAFWKSLDHVSRQPEALNTLVQVGMVLLIWCMVKTRFLFRVIPR